MNHYVYLLIDTNPNGLQEFYIGCRSCACNIDEDTYMGSSKSMKEETRNRCDKIVLEEFSTRIKALAYEILLHTQFNVAINPKFYNNAKQTSTGFDTTGKTFIFTDKHRENMRKAGLARSKDSYPRGWKHTDTAKKAIRDSKLGVSRDRETVERQRTALKNRYASDLVNPMQGRQHSEETKKKISEKRIQSKHGKGSKGVRFSPWFIKYPDGTYEEFRHISKVEQSIKDGHVSYKYQELSKTGQEIKRGKFKGYTVGNIVNS